MRKQPKSKDVILPASAMVNVFTTLGVILIDSEEYLSTIGQIRMPRGYVLRRLNNGQSYTIEREVA